MKKCGLDRSCFKRYANSNHKYHSGGCQTRAKKPFTNVGYNMFKLHALYLDKYFLNTIFGLNPLYVIWHLLIRTTAIKHGKFVYVEQVEIWACWNRKELKISFHILADILIWLTRTRVVFPTERMLLNDCGSTLQLQTNDSDINMKSMYPCRNIGSRTMLSIDLSYCYIFLR